MIWQPVCKLKHLPPESFVLARTGDRHIMVFRVNILMSVLDGRTPNHLQFPATHFIPADQLLALSVDGQWPGGTNA